MVRMILAFEFGLISLPGTSKSTKVDIKGGQHPLWDDEFRFPVIKHLAPKFRDLKVSCFAKEHRNDDLIGEGTLDITETLRTGKYDGAHSASLLDLLLTLVLAQTGSSSNVAKYT